MSIVACPECGKEVGSENRLRMHRQVHGVDPGWAKPSRARVREEEGAAVPSPLVDDSAQAALFETEQAAPVKPKRRFSMFGREEERPSQPDRPTREARPSRPVRRTDASDLFTRIWATVGRRIELNVGDVPVGRSLQLTSGATGIILDDAVKGTAADRPVQWLVRTEAKVSKVGAVLAVPIVVGMMERNPAAAEALAPFLIDALMSLGPSMIRALKKEEKRRADFAEAMAGLGPALGLADDEPVTPDLLLQWLFPPMPAQAPAPAAAA